MANILTRESLLKITMKGDNDAVVCRYCGESESIPFPFIPFRVKIDNTKSFLVKNREQLIRNFLETHLGRHIIQEKRKSK